jgi:predicted HTH domain antitoxin
MSTTVSFEIPREVLRASRLTEDELRRELALHLFEEEKLSFGKARELAQMSVGDFQQFLGSRGIPVHDDVEAYENDRETLRRLGRIGRLLATHPR